MFHCLPSDAHTVRRFVQTGLHRFEDLFMLPTRNAPLFASRAFGFEFTVFARGAPVTIDRHLMLDRTVSPNQPLPCRTPIFIGFGMVNEIRFIESACRLGA